MAKTQLPLITICSSANFYRKAGEIQEILQAQGFEVLIPAMAKEMKRTGDYEVAHHKTWLAEPDDYHKKAALIRGHFAEVDKADAILVLNYEKNGKQNYIGGNVLMEMALAFHAGKPIFIMNEIPEDSAYLEEIKGMEPILLHGDIGNFKTEYSKAQNN